MDLLGTPAIILIFLPILESIVLSSLSGIFADPQLTSRVRVLSNKVITN